MHSPLPRLLASKYTTIARGKTTREACCPGKPASVEENRRSAALFRRFRCRMGGRWDVALARVCCVACVAVMLATAPARTESATACRFEAAGTAKVRAITDGRSFTLEDGARDSPRRYRSPAPARCR